MAPDASEPGDPLVDEVDDADDTVVDPRDVVKLLRADGEQREAMLERYSSAGRVERDIVRELATTQPIADVAGFNAAHSNAMRAIEVLTRNGSRPPRMPKLAFVKPIAQAIVGLVLGFIIRNYRNSLSQSIRRLYERRYAAAPPGSAARGLLLRARRDITVVDDGFSGGGAGVPAFLVGGALLSTVIASIESALIAVFDTPFGVSVVALVGMLLLVLIAWSAMFAAAVARRRIRLTTEQPALALWAVMGAAGEPPDDQSFLFAIIAIVLAIAAWVLVPVAAYAIIS